MQRNDWPEVTICDGRPLPSCALAPSQQVYIHLCRGIEKLARIAADECAHGSLTAADRTREVMFGLVRQLGPAMFDIVEEFGGPVENCRDCGDIVALCRCEDVPFAEEV